MLDPTLVDQIRARLGRAPFANWFGIEMVSVDLGTAELRLALADHHLNPGGIAHGGVAAALLDSVIGLALRTTLAQDASHATITLSVAYLRPVSTGSILARGRAVHSGRRVEYGEGELLDDAGRLVARGNASFVVTSQRPD